MHRRIRLNAPLRTLAAVMFAVGGAACAEDLDSGAACPLLCPQPTVNVRDTVIFPVVLDSSVAGVSPLFAEENLLVLAARGDTIDTRVILRFDTLLTRFRLPGASQDSVATRVDSAYLYLQLQVPDTIIAPVTIEVYEIDSLNVPEPDTVAASLASRFTAERVIGRRTVLPSDSLRDSLRIPISAQAVEDRMNAGTRLRIGLRAVSDSGLQLNFFSSEAGSPPFVRYWVWPDTTVGPLTVPVQSRRPLLPGWLASALADYVIIAAGPPPPPAGVLEVGGYRPRRTYLRFEIPSFFSDSASVVRATLLLTQRSNPTSPARRDSIAVVAVPILAGNAVTDIRAALRLMTTTAADSVRLAPLDSGVREFDIVRIVRQWALTRPDAMPRAIGLGSMSEGHGLGTVQFFSMEAATALQPRLRITYVPRLSFTLP